MSKRLVKLVVVCSLVAICIALAGTLPVGQQQTVSGHINCSSGAAIVGIWVDASNGGSGWAVWTPQPGQPSSASYKYTLPAGGKFAVNVGCGGTPAKWATNNKSASTYGPTRDFVCYGIPGRPQSQTCG